MLQGHDPPGSLVGVTLGSYRVTGRIGAGGMGVVYRALDLRLGRAVAVKALPETTDAGQAVRRTLMDEARRGSRVVSPYVATVFDVVEQDGSAYIVMEYIEGRRLDDVVQKDRPDLKRVTGYAIEIAEALTAIHAAGLVHRDMKPGNVMVTPSGHVKVMDFGLASENAAELLHEVGDQSTQTTQTAPGNVAGTVLYMSPEQLRDEPLDARSDLFSFGTLLHEAVTGVHPFARETILASASAILHEPPAGSGVAPGVVPPPIAPIVGRLLEKDRERRYASAELLLNDLRAAQAGQIVAAQPAPVKKPFVRRTVVAMAIGIAAIAFAAYRYWPSKPSPPGRPVVAVLPFEDKTGEPRGDLYAQLLADLIASNLAESSLVRALPDERIQEILRGVDLHAPQLAGLAAVSKAADPRWIVSGTLYKEGDASYAMVKVFQPGKSEPLDSFRVNGGSASALAERASAKLQEQLFPDRKEAVPAGAKGKAGASTSEEAQLLEGGARRATRELRYHDAIDMLEKATKLDPEFLAAQARYADALDWAGYSKRAGETADRAARIVERLGSAANGDSNVLTARAVLARIRGKADDELKARRAIVAQHPDDPPARLALANALAGQGQSTEAFPEVDIAIELDPKDPNSHLFKARLLSDAQRFDDAAAEIDRAEALIKEAGSAVGEARIERARAYSAFLKKSFVQSAEAYQRAARAFETAGLPVLAAQSLKGAGDCELKQGHLDAARAIYDRVLTVARSAGDSRTIVGTLSSTGGVRLTRGEYEQAARDLKEARDEALKLGNPRLLAGVTLNLASAEARLGRDDEARSLAESALGVARDAEDFEVQGKAMLRLANAYYREGRFDEAIHMYSDVRDSPRLAQAQGNPLGSVYLGLTEIQRELGRLKGAAEAADQAVSVNRAANDRPLLGYSLVERARVRADLRLDAGAEQDLDEAGKLASDPKAMLADLARTVGLGRAALAARKGHWQEAERELAALRNETGTPNGAGFDASVFSLSAEVATELGRSEDAIRYARSVDANTAASPVERVQGRMNVARAHARGADHASASSEARRSLADAERLGLPYIAAVCCAVLTELQDGTDIEAIRARGREYVARYLDAAPESARENLRARSDVRVMIRALSSDAR